MNQPQNIIAIVYDFDHTLSPHYMQDHTILRHAELEPSTFWKSCTALIEARDYDQELAYMKRMLEEPRIRTLSNQDLRDMGNQLSFFPGVPSFFQELNEILQKPKYEEVPIRLEHYVVSSGLKAILEGSVVASQVKAILDVNSMKKMGISVFPNGRSATHRKPNFYFVSIKG